MVLGSIGPGWLGTSDAGADFTAEKNVFLGSDGVIYAEGGLKFRVGT